MGFAPTWLHQVNPPASQNHFNHCPSLSKITYKYNSILTYIPVSFLFSFNFMVQVKNRVSVRVSFRVRIGLGFGFGIGNLTRGAGGTVGPCARKMPGLLMLKIGSMVKTATNRNSDTP